MTFDTDEKSIQSSQPIELYAFTLGGDKIYLTNASTRFTDGLGNAYQPSAIGRNQPTYSIEKVGSELQIQIPIGDEAGADLVAAFIPRPPSGLTSVQVVQVQPTASRAFWNGFIVSSNYNDDFMTMLARPLSDIITQTGPRRGFGLLCQHVLFDARCTLNELSHKQTGTVSAITNGGLTFTVPGLSAPTNRFTNGTIRLAGGFAQGMIASQAGNDFTVRYPIPEIFVGASVEVVEGCNQDVTDCTAFGNIANFGGFPYTPTDTNPFEKGLDKAV